MQTLEPIHAPLKVEARARDRDAENQLQRELGIPSLLAGALVARGYRDPALADRFLNPSLDQLGDPAKLPDYRAAVDEILGARERREKIFVHGDYDVDGVTSAALFGRFLETTGCEVQVHVPHRMKHGYGIHHDAVRQAHESGAKLFLTCDCGVSAHEQVEAARELGMRVVVTDHHTVGETLPSAHAVVNPHRRDSEYPFAELCGAGVVFRLCEGITRELDFPVDRYRRAFLDLAVLGTVADVMPLLDENRIIAAFGIQELRKTKKVGLQELIEVAGLNKGKVLKCGHIGFQLGPRLNAAGRIDDAALSLQLLLERDSNRARALATQIDQINTSRKDQMNRSIEDAVAQIEAMDLSGLHAIVVGSADWHPGIIGLVASRLVEKFHRPAYVMAFNEETGVAKGSARSIPGFDLYESIKGLGDLVSGGGHRMAAGFSAKLGDVERVQAAFNAYASERLTAEDFLPRVEVDLSPDDAELTFDQVNALARMEPFGTANPEPRFARNGLELKWIKPVNKAMHFQLAFSSDAEFKGVRFGELEPPAWAKPGIRVASTFRLSANDYMGRRTVELLLEALVPFDANLSGPGSGSE